MAIKKYKRCKFCNTQRRDASLIFNDLGWFCHNKNCYEDFRDNKNHGTRSPKKTLCSFCKKRKVPEKMMYADAGAFCNGNCFFNYLIKRAQAIGRQRHKFCAGCHDLDPDYEVLPDYEVFPALED